MKDTAGPKIHIHSSGENGLFANGYLVESAHGVVAIDGTLTKSESRAFRAELDALQKPLLAVLITHAHPDHIAGITELTRDMNVPIVALESVKTLMQKTEQIKHAQWKPVFKEEWIDTWTYPNNLVKDGQVLSFDDIRYRAYDFGPGGDCDANTIWVMETEPRAAFVGDLIFNGLHSYTADDHILAWLANLERARSLFSDIPLLYPGHGRPGNLDLLTIQRDYLLTYCVAVKDLAQGKSTLDEAAKQKLVERMTSSKPGASLTFMIALGADAVTAELAGKKE